MYQYPDYLMHYGVHGMKWGVRRANNKKHSSNSSKKKSKNKKKLKNVNKSITDFATSKSFRRMIQAYYGYKIVDNVLTDHALTSGRKAVGKVIKNSAYSIIQAYHDTHPTYYWPT